MRKLLPTISVAAVAGAAGFIYLAPAKTSTSTSVSLDAVVQAVIQIESNGNPKAQRYEKHINDTSYGLMQILTRTARDLERRHAYLPRLGTSAEAIKVSLTNGEINVRYGQALLQEEVAFYGDRELAVAAYNAGHFAPRNARVQEQLNDLLGTALKPDGSLGKQSQEAIRAFQQKYNREHTKDQLEEDGVLGAKTYGKLQNAWQSLHPNKSNPRGIIPQNRTTPYHVQKFTRTLRSILREE